MLYVTRASICVELRSFYYSKVYFGPNVVYFASCINYIVTQHSRPKKAGGENREQGHDSKEKRTNKAAETTDSRRIVHQKDRQHGSKGILKKLIFSI